MYLPQKDPQTEEQVQWGHLKEYAYSFDVEVKEDGQSFCLFWNFIASTFIRNAEGIIQATNWIENIVAPEYEGEEI